MQQIVTTGRLISRALWNGFTNLSPTNTEHVNKKREPSFLYAVCGFPKESSRKHHPIKGKFGDDAWFSAKGKATDVLGNSIFMFFYLVKNINYILLMCKYVCCRHIFY